MAAMVSSYPQSMGTSYHHFSLDRKRVEGRSKRGRVKTVSWMPDSQICQVRQFLSADAPMKLGPLEHGILRQNTTSSHEVMDLPPGFGVHVAKQARVEIYMPVQYRWGPPPKFIMRGEWMVANGDESLESRYQRDRELRMLEAIYPRMTSIPDSPAEPDASFNAVDENVPLIPIEECDDNESTHNDCEELTSETSRATESSLGGIKLYNSQHVQQQSNLGENKHLTQDMNQNHDQNNVPKVESRNNEVFCFGTNLNAVIETRKGPVMHQEPLESIHRTSKTSQPQNTKSLCEHIAAAAAAASSELRAKGIAQRDQVITQRDPLVEYPRMSFLNHRNEPAGLNNGNVSCNKMQQNSHAKLFESVNRFHDARQFNSLASSALDTPLNGVEAPFMRTSRITVADTNLHHYANGSNNVPLQQQSNFTESYRPQQQTNFGQVERPMVSSEMRPWGHGHETFQINNTSNGHDRPSVHPDVTRCERVPFASLSHPNAYQAPQITPANLSSSQPPTFGGPSGRDLRFNKPAQSDNKNVAPKPFRGKKLCIYFNTARGCLRGGNCAFLHQSNDAHVNTIAK